MQGYENQPDPQHGDTPGVQDRRDTGERTLGTPEFSWDADGEVLTVEIDVDLPAEPPGAPEGESVVYQVWGTMQESETPPNAVTWGTTTNRYQDETNGISTPFRNKRATPSTDYTAGDVSTYFAVQVTVRNTETGPNIDETVAFVAPGAPA